MKNNDQILNLFENYLAQIQFPEEPEQLYKPIIYSMSGGGKRIRPTLLLLACEAFGGDVQQALPAAAAVEMFHNFTLLHDDIMDNADVRRDDLGAHFECEVDDLLGLFDLDLVFLCQLEAVTAEVAAKG